MAFIVALVLLAAFIVNVVLGAVADAPLLGSVGEMLVLFGASTAFVAGILKREAQVQKDREAAR